MAEETGRRRVHERWAHLRFSVIGQLLAAPPDKGELKAAFEMQDAEAGEALADLGRGHGRAVVAQGGAWQAALLERLGEAVRDHLGSLGQIPLQMAGEARAVVEDAEQDGRHPFAARREHLPRSVMAVPMPQAVDILGLVAADLALDNACLGTLGPFGSARAQAAALVETIGAHEATQRGIGRHGLEIWLRLGQRDKVVVVELDAPALVCGVLRDDDATHGRADGVLPPGVGAQLAAQHADRIGALVERAVVPALDGREAEADRLARRRMPPDAGRSYQNAKQEAFWGPVEGRLIAMLEHVPDLTLAFLNEATQAWVEHEYNRSIHSEIATTPLARFLEGPTVTRPCPGSDALRLAFTRSAIRTQKKSDGSIVIEGRRFEVPNRYRHLARIEVRYAAWDLSTVHLVDERTGNVLARLYPQDKTQNASGLRRSLEPISPPPIEPAPRAPASPIPPLLQRLLNTQSSVGLPPAYLPKDEDEGDAS